MTDDPYDLDADDDVDGCPLALFIGTIYGFTLGAALVGILWWVL